jgi:succinate dehydrogenase/fumarate reductase cytochrome b subunit
LVFVLGHLWELRFQRLFFGLSSAAVQTTLSAHLSSTVAGFPWAAVLYLFGTFAAVFHLANGLFAATDALGVATTASGRARARLLTTVLGAILFLLGAGAVFAFATGTRLLPGPGGDSPPGSAPCGTDPPSR